MEVLEPVTIRPFVDGKLHAELKDADAVDFDSFCDQHILNVVERRYMFEIEFLAEPDPMQRFFRFGNEPTNMVLPIRLIDAIKN